MTRSAAPASAPEPGETPAALRPWPLRPMVIITVVLAVGLVVALVVALVVWHTPALTPVPVPVVPSA